MVVVVVSVAGFSVVVVTSAGFSVVVVTSFVIKCFKNVKKYYP